LRVDLIGAWPFSQARALAEQTSSQNTQDGNAASIAKEEHASSSVERRESAPDCSLEASAAPSTVEVSRQPTAEAQGQHVTEVASERG
jgi:hypothetical protein